MSSGQGIATKGLISEGTDEVSTLSNLPPGFGTAPGTPTLRQDAQVIVVIPTAINTCLMAAENITDNLRAQQAANLALPSMYKRAYLVANQTDEIAVVKE